MLKGIDPLLEADLLHALCAMGHGDSVALVDANFPASSHTTRLLRLPGLGIGPVLRAVLSVLPLDDFIPDPARIMQVVGDPTSVPEAAAEMAAIVREHGGPALASLDRFAFYDQSRAAFAIVQTGERRLYGNVILVKGVLAG